MSDEDFPIEELARRTGLSVRNVRSYMSRGLLPPGRMQGRAARFDRSHLDRLDLINGLRRRGFTLAAIEVLVNQAATGTAEEALRLYRGMLTPWQPEEPVEIDADGLLAWLGIAADDPLAAEARLSVPDLCAAGLAEHTGTGGLRILQPGIVRAGGEAIRLGMSVASVLTLRRRLDVHTGHIAELFLELFAEQVWAGFVQDGLPTERTPSIQATVESLQPVATLALLSSFRSRMQDAMDVFIEQISSDIAPSDAARVVGIREQPQRAARRRTTR